MVDEGLIPDDADQADEEVQKEACPILPEDYTREFEEYLDEIGLRF